jgi:hypothetical protein
MRVRNVLLSAVIAIVSVGGPGCTKAPRQRPVEGGPVDTGPGTLTAARKFLEGRWSLESFEVFPPGGTPIKVQGTGVLTYDDFGNLRIDIRVDPKTGDMLRSVGIDVRDGAMTTEGRTAVDLQNRTLTYILEGQPALGAPSGPLALNRPRHWVVEGDLLTLSTRDANGTVLSTGRWRKQP